MERYIVVFCDGTEEIVELEFVDLPSDLDAAEDEMITQINNASSRPDEMDYVSLRRP